jgi:hypothetical protein
METAVKLFDDFVSSQIPAVPKCTPNTSRIFSPLTPNNVELQASDIVQKHREITMCVSQDTLCMCIPTILQEFRDLNSLYESTRIHPIYRLYIYFLRYRLDSMIQLACILQVPLNTTCLESLSLKLATTEYVENAKVFHHDLAEILPIFEFQYILSYDKLLHFRSEYPNAYLCANITWDNLYEVIGTHLRSYSIKDQIEIDSHYACLCSSDSEVPLIQLSSLHWRSLRELCESRFDATDVASTIGVQASDPGGDC